MTHVIRTLTALGTAIATAATLPAFALRVGVRVTTDTTGIQYEVFFAKEDM